MALDRFLQANEVEEIPALAEEVSPALLPQAIDKKNIQWLSCELYHKNYHNSLTGPAPDIRWAHLASETAIAKHTIRSGRPCSNSSHVAARLSTWAGKLCWPKSLSF